MAESTRDGGTGAGTGIALESVYDVFISYNRSDKRTVKKLAHLLSQKGLKPWLDEWNLIPGAPWQPEIEKELRKCRSVAVLIGPGGLSPWQSEEMRAAIARRVHETKGLFRLIPVLLPGANRDVVSDVQFLSAASWVEFTRSIDDEEQVHRLVCGIRGIEPGEWAVDTSGKNDAVRYFFIIAGTASQLDRAKIESIVELLRRYSGDTDLTIREIKDGSIRMLIDGTRIGYDRLIFLFRTGQLSHVLDLEVQGLELLSDQKSSDSEDPGSGSTQGSQGGFSSPTGPGSGSSFESRPRSAGLVRVPPIPPGYRTATPYLTVNNAARALDFYKRAFGAQEVMRMDGPDGKIGHAEIKIGDSMIMLADEMPGSGSRSPQSLGGTTARVFLYVENVDALFKQAVAAGAQAESQPADMFWGDRYGRLTDPFGHSWAIATHTEDVAPEEMKKRMREQMRQRSQQREHKARRA